jgi:hypothetical protein
VHCLKDCFTWVNHKTTGIPPAREYLQQRLEVEEGSRAWLPTFNIFSHFSRGEIGRLVEELCRTGLYLVAANQAELRTQNGWREVIFYPRSDDFQAFFQDNEAKLDYPLITRLLQAIDAMRRVAGCTPSTKLIKIAWYNTS